MPGRGPIDDQGNPVKTIWLSYQSATAEIFLSVTPFSTTSEESQVSEEINELDKSHENLCIVSYEHLEKDIRKVKNKFKSLPFDWEEEDFKKSYQDVYGV